MALDNSFFSTTGNDTTGNGSISAPYLTPKKAVDNVNPGGTVWGRGGDHSGVGMTVAQNVGWLENIPAGSAGAHTTVSAYDGEPCKLIATNGTSHYNVIGPPLGVSYLTFKDLIIDGNGGTATWGVNIGDGFATNNNITLDGLEITDPQGLCLVRFCTDLIVQNCVIHDEFEGTNLDHGLYLQEVDNAIIQDNTFYNISGYCIHVYQGSNPQRGTSNNMIWRRNICYNFATSSGSDQAAMLLSTGNDAWIYNNLIYAGHANSGMGVRLTSTGSYAPQPLRAKILHNTIVGTPKQSVYLAVGSGHFVQNNILLDYGTAAVFNSTSGSTVNDNLTSAVLADTFVDPTNATLASRDYQLKAGSVAINPGISFKGVTDDILGVTRTAPDYGAYEFSAITPSSPVLGVSLSQTVTPGVLRPLGADAVDPDGNIVTGYAFVTTGNAGLDFDPSGCAVTHKTSL